MICCILVFEAGSNSSTSANCWLRWSINTRCLYLHLLYS